MKPIRQLALLVCLPFAAGQALAQSCPLTAEDVGALTAARKVTDRVEQDDDDQDAFVTYQGANYKLLGAAPIEVRVQSRDQHVKEAIIGLPGKNLPAYMAALKKSLPPGGKLECDADMEECKWELGRKAEIGELEEIRVYDTIYFKKDTTLMCTYASPRHVTIVDMLIELERQKKR
ncbi:hypothetical protein [Massilia sp. ST3]|uniref:hypothetical protein n=1 Tax=Massilia sp. ST3 TaxID=2824903 RepID=UPI001B813E07|nr:hypothetical protein [Massilia sp. ST3]MBQ5946982.1 hypothetical protein [Massilia sp. ST3]